jgi:type I restriction enzyme S subunit
MNTYKQKQIDEVYSGYTYFRENDVVVAKITPCFENGKGAQAAGLLNGIGFGTTEFHVLRALEEFDKGYLFYLTITHAFRDIGASEMLGAGGQKRVPEEFIKDFRLGIPPLEEQKSISMHIKSELNNIDKMSRINKDAIERYEEYRSAIITAAVTGKIDVRNIKIGKDAA